MKSLTLVRLITFAALSAWLSLACSAATLFPSVPDVAWPTPVPPPADAGTPTGSSPMSGDWGATTDFGKLSFRISPDGTTLEALYVEMNNWTCGGVTLTTGVNTYTNPPTLVDNGRISMGVSLNNAGDHYHNITVTGDYDQDTNKFTGTWREKAFNTICEGTWETASR